VKKNTFTAIKDASMIIPLQRIIAL